MDEEAGTTARGEIVPESLQGVLSMVSLGDGTLKKFSRDSGRFYPGLC